jgi:hypothetical protein
MAKTRGKIQPIPQEDLFDMINKNLRLAIDYKVGGATRILFSVYFAIADRYSNRAEQPKECHDSNEWIAKRAKVSKNSLEDALQWLIKWSFVLAEYRVKIFTPTGTEEKAFTSIQDAVAFVKLFRSGGGNCKDPHRVFLPPKQNPTLDELGLELVDKNNGIYRVRGTQKNESIVPNNCGDDDQELSKSNSKFDESTYENWGTKLDPSNEIHQDEMESNEIDSKKIEEMVITNNLHPRQKRESILTEDLLKPFTVKDLKSDRPPDYDPNFWTCKVILNTLSDAGFVGAANLELRRSSLHTAVSKVQPGHFLYAAIKCVEHGKSFDWVEELLSEYENEFEDLSTDLLKLLTVGGIRSIMDNIGTHT